MPYCSFLVVFSDIEMMLALYLAIFTLTSLTAEQDINKEALNDIQDDFKDRGFILTVDEDHVKGVVKTPLNFTVSIEKESWEDEQVELFWESTRYHIMSRDEMGHKVVFTKTGPASQVVEVESDLIGIFLLRLVLVLPRQSLPLCSDSTG